MVIGSYSASRSRRYRESLGSAQICLREIDEGDILLPCVIIFENLDALKLVEIVCKFLNLK